MSLLRAVFERLTAGFGPLSDRVPHRQGGSGYAYAVSHGTYFRHGSGSGV